MCFGSLKGYPQRELEHEVQLMSDSPLQHIGLYRKFVIEVSKKTIGVATGTWCHSTEYITTWVTHHHCVEEGWDLADVY